MYGKRDAGGSWRDFNWRAGCVCRETILFSIRPKSSGKRNKTK
jgi:hypothetical protein